jgi:hypothetical protein
MTALEPHLENKLASTREALGDKPVFTKEMLGTSLGDAPPRATTDWHWLSTATHWVQYLVTELGISVRQ